MELKPLGSTGVMVSEIGLGTWNFRGGPEVIQRSLELGATLIDTAEVYRTEENVARGIRGRRGQCFIATKVSGANLRYKEVLKAADASLQRLETDYIDLYQVHWPNSRIPIGQTMRAMAELVAGGKVRYVGVSNFSVREIQEAQEALGEYPIVSNQVLYNIFSREIEAELVPYCQEHRVTVMAYSPLAEGNMNAELRSRPELARAVGEVCAATAKTRAQVLLNWCVHDPVVITIPKTDRVERVEENCAASGWRLTPEQYTALSAAAG